MAPLPEQERLTDLTTLASTPPWLDVFALSACRFLIGTQSGPASVPQTFGLPVLVTNSTAMCLGPYLTNTLTLPKLARVKGSTDPMGMREMVGLGLGSVDGYIPANLSNSDGGLQWRDNTPYEIAEATKEMLAEAYLDQPSAPQREFEALAVSTGSHGVSRPCNSFLAEHWD